MERGNRRTSAAESKSSDFRSFTCVNASSHAEWCGLFRFPWGCSAPCKWPGAQALGRRPWHDPCSTDNRSSAMTFFRRLVGAALLDNATYEEVEADRTANAQTLAVVVMSSAAAAVGARGTAAGAAWTFFASASVLALLTWAAFALLTFEVGSRILPTPETRIDPGELLRTLGFAAAPELIQVFGVVPEIRRPAFVLAICWT